GTVVPAVELLISAILWFSPWDGMGLLPEPVIVSSETPAISASTVSVLPSRSLAPMVTVLPTASSAFSTSSISKIESHEVGITSSKASSAADAGPPAAYSTIVCSEGNPAEGSEYSSSSLTSRYSILTNTIGSTISTWSRSSSVSISSSSKAGVPNSDIVVSASGSYSLGSLALNPIEASVVCAGIT